MLTSLLIVLSAHTAPPQWVNDSRFALALYCNTTCSDETISQIENELAFIPTARRLPRSTWELKKTIGVASTVDFPPPDLSTMQSLAQGIDNENASTLYDSKEVLIVEVAVSHTQKLDTIRRTYQAFKQIALKSGGIVEEIATSRIYSPEAFSGHVEEILVEPFDTSTMFIVETMGEQEPFTLSTRGMRALGLHEIRVPYVVEKELEDLTTVINLVAQIGYERGGIESQMYFTDLSTTNKEVRKRSIGIEGGATFYAASSYRDEPKNPVVEMLFTGKFDAPASGSWEDYGMQPPQSQISKNIPDQKPITEQKTIEPTTISKNDTVMVALPPAITAPLETGPSNLEEALTKAYKNLTGPVKEEFITGLDAGDKLLIKAPFQTEDGRIEYLWLEVKSWNQTVINGILLSTPNWVDVTVGANYQIEEQTVYDYILKRADGSKEGNETEAFIR